MKDREEDVKKFNGSLFLYFSNCKGIAVRVVPYAAIFRRIYVRKFKKTDDFM